MSATVRRIAPISSEGNSSAAGRRARAATDAAPRGRQSRYLRDRCARAGREGATDRRVRSVRAGGRPRDAAVSSPNVSASSPGLEAQQEPDTQQEDRRRGHRDVGQGAVLQASQQPKSDFLARATDSAPVSGRGTSAHRQRRKRDPAKDPATGRTASGRRCQEDNSRPTPAPSSTERERGGEVAGEAPSKRRSWRRGWRQG